MDTTDTTAALWAEWAETAESDVVPDFYRTETMPDGTAADHAMWFHDDGSLKDTPPG